MKKLKAKASLHDLQNKFESNWANLENQNILIQQLEDVNQKLKDSESMKSNFLSNIKNEINDPLASVIGLARTLSEHGTDNIELTKKLSKHIYTEILNLDFHLKNIFAAAEIEAGEASLEVAVVDIKELVLELIDICSQKSANKRHEILLHLPENQKTAYRSFKTDASKIRLIIMNILINALEQTPENKKILISIEINSHILSLSIKDSGAGIRKTNQSKIFNRFEKIENVNHKGQGLGLAVTKGLIELLNGKIVIKDNETSGTTFTVEIPEAEIHPDLGSSNGNEFLFDVHEKF